MPKLNSAAMLYAAKKNDYERVKLLFRYLHLCSNAADSSFSTCTQKADGKQICLFDVGNEHSRQVCFVTGTATAWKGLKR